jgi:hypothetical protein
MKAHNPDLCICVLCWAARIVAAWREGMLPRLQWWM